MGFDGRAVANFVLDHCDEAGRQLTNLGLQKVVYFCHGWHLGLLKKPLIRHQFEAWRYGPVLQYLYRDFREFENNPITRRASRLDPETGTISVVEHHFEATTEDLLTSVVQFYSGIKSGTLVELSHAAGGPWDAVWNHEEEVNPGMKIDDARIMDFFSSRPPPF